MITFVKKIGNKMYLEIPESAKKIHDIKEGYAFRSRVTMKQNFILISFLHEQIKTKY